VTKTQKFRFRISSEEANWRKILKENRCKLKIDATLWSKKQKILRLFRNTLVTAHWNYVNISLCKIYITGSRTILFCYIWKGRNNYGWYRNTFKVTSGKYEVSSWIVKFNDNFYSSGTIVLLFLFCLYWKQ